MASERGPERPWAVALMRRLDALGELLSTRSLRRRLGGPAWPVVAGAYVVGNPAAPVAICTLTDNELPRAAAALTGVAIAGRVYTANLGIEKVIVNLTANPRIRFVLLCGRDSPLFHPGQTLQALVANGVASDGRVIGAEGYLPVLGNVSRERIEQFRRQVQVVDRTGETDLAALGAQARELAARNPGPLPMQQTRLDAATLTGVAEDFDKIRPGGRREPLVYDPRGYFVVTLDRSAGEIVLRHYRPDNSPAHEMRGRSAESMLLGLVREDLISQLSHAGYLGGELAKAEAALRLGLRYEQDQPLRPADAA